MAQPYIGEIRMFAGSFAPAGWASCEGQLMPIAENDALFTLIGTTYGGDGESTFGLPDLRGRLPLHQGNGFVLAQAAGVESVTLTTQQIPVHTHPFLGSGDIAGSRDAANNALGRATAEAYASEFTPETLAPQSISPQGGSQPHDNMHPFLCISFIISLYGIFPTQT